MRIEIEIGTVQHANPVHMQSRYRPSEWEPEGLDVQWMCPALKVDVKASGIPEDLPQEWKDEVRVEELKEKLQSVVECHFAPMMRKWHNTIKEAMEKKVEELYSFHIPTELDAERLMGKFSLPPFRCNP